MTGFVAIVLFVLTFAPQENQKIVLPMDNIRWVAREETGEFSRVWWLKDCEVALSRDGLELVIITNVAYRDRGGLTEIINLKKGNPAKIICLLKQYSGPQVSCPPDARTSGKTLFEEHFKEQAKQLPHAVQDLLADLYVQ